MLNRPEKRNAMSPELHAEMDDAVARLEFDDDVRCLVVHGAGGNFSAGQDLKQFFRELENKPFERRKAQEMANSWRWARLWSYDKPTIAMVDGYCVGGAFMQLIGCDFAIAAEDATFSLSEVNWGILPGALVAKAVADALLPRHAMYYCATGDAFDGKEAERIGLDQLRGAERSAEAPKRRRWPKRLMSKSPKVLACDEASRAQRAHDGRHAVVRLPRRKGPRDSRRRQGRLVQHGSAAVPR